MVDLIINCVAINMTWDVRYYYKALNYLWPETFRELSPRLGRGDGHCDGIAGQPVPTGLRRLNGNMRDGNDGSVPMNGSETPRSVARSCNKERSCSPRRPDLSRQSVGFDSKMTNNKITVGSCASDFAMP
uniref:Uncharacterized protein n=1 Tax=Lotharella globosa TaxID=91324 RepID=A0A7S3YPM7_9EUKA